MACCQPFASCHMTSQFPLLPSVCCKEEGLHDGEFRATWAACGGATWRPLLGWRERGGGVDPRALLGSLGRREELGCLFLFACGQRVGLPVSGQIQ